MTPTVTLLIVEDYSKRAYAVRAQADRPAEAVRRLVDRENIGRACIRRRVGRRVWKVGEVGAAGLVIGSLDRPAAGAS